MFQRNEKHFAKLAANVERAFPVARVSVDVTEL